MRSRITILTCTPVYLPGFKGGGPVRTIANMVERLGDELDFHIITSDRDMHDSQPYADVKVDTWNSVGKAQIFYASAARCSLRGLSQLINATPHDVLYLNSFFHPVFTLLPLVARRLGLLPNRSTVLAPRGEFSKGALSLKSLKKRVYLITALGLGLYKDLTWQASSNYELNDIRRTVGAVAQRIIVAPNLPSNNITVDPDTHSNPQQLNKRTVRVCFLSRISPMKNLCFALRVLRRVSVPVHFNIVGPIEDEKYWSECLELIALLPKNIETKLLGEVKHDKVASIIGEHDLFFLPTKGENFGHVIVEALTAGTPVLISDATPWRGLEKDGVGWDLPLEAEHRFVDVIEKVATEYGDAYAARRQRVRTYAQMKLTSPAIVKANMDLFRQAEGLNKQMWKST